jgi:hypothetical protein
MKSKFNIGFLLAFAFYFIFFGTASVVAIYSTIVHDEVNPLGFISIIFFLGGLYYLYNLKIFYIKDEEIIIKYLLRFSKVKYSFQDIVGFKWKYSYFPSIIASVIIVTSNLNEYRLFDFDYRNFFELERFIISKFKIYKDKSLKSDYIKFAKNEYFLRDKFHSKQNGFLKFHIILWAILFIPIIFALDSGLIDNYSRNNIIWPIATNIIFVGIYILVIFRIVKLITQGKTIVYKFNEDDYIKNADAQHTL